jgi:hypothetical protein
MRFSLSIAALARVAFILGMSLLLEPAAPGQSAARLDPKFVTVPITLDHNRIVIDVDLPLPDGSTIPVRAWVDIGSPELRISQHVAKLMGLDIACDGHTCSAKPPPEIMIGGIRITLTSLKTATIPLKPQSATAVIEDGMTAEINLPSTVLRNHDVLIDFPGRVFSIGLPGSLKFNGVKSKMQVSPESGLIQIPSKIENKSYSLGLALGSPFSFLSKELFDKLAADHADWPRMTGAIGPANISGGEDATKRKLMRVDRLQYGPLFLTRVAVAELPKDRIASVEKRAGVPTVGMLGANALINYRIGLDYAHSTVYFEIGRTFNFPDFDVVGLTLRPEDDGQFTIIGVAEFDGQASVPDGQNGVQAGDHLVAIDGIPVRGSTLGQVWSQLGGTPGQERKLSIERDGKQFVVAARVQHFLGESPAEAEPRGKAKKK